LIIVDGVQMAATDINSLDLSNIERVEVVQGAASAALYGAQGANGAIQLFTKKGRSGTPTINFSTSYAENSFINSGDLNKASLHPYIVNSDGQVRNINTGDAVTFDETGSVEGISYEFGGPARYGILNPGNVADNPYVGSLQFHDHFKQIFRKGYTTNNSVNISGGNSTLDYNVSAANVRTKTAIMDNGALDRSNLSANIGIELFKGFKIRSTTQLVFTKNNMDYGLGGGGGFRYGKGDKIGNIGSVWSFLNTSPFFDLEAPLADGTPPAYQYAEFLSVNAFNPFYQAYYTTNLDKKIDVVQSFNASYQVNKFLELEGRYGINYRTQNVRFTALNQSENVNSEYWESWAGIYAPDNDGEVANWDYNTTFQNVVGNAVFRTDFKEDFNMNVPIQTSTQVMFDYRKNVYREYSTYGVGLPLSPPTNMRATGSQFVDQDYVETFVTYGYLINQKVDIGDWGGVTAGFRTDWSSAFGAGSKPFTFPHFDGYILPSSFLKNSTVGQTLSYFKLRAAYGEAGIQPGAFDRYPVLDPGGLGSQSVYMVQNAPKDPNLSVEVSKEFEAGTDFTFQLNRSGGSWLNLINAGFTYWNRKSENVIYEIATPPSSGAPLQLTNAIDMSSHGIQFSVNIPVFESNKFSWDFTTNFGKQSSMIDDISGGANIILTSSAGSTALTLSPGVKIGQIYGFKALTSIDQLKEDGTRYISEADAGKYTMVDGRVVNIETKGIQFTQNTYPLGDPYPKFNMSFINSFGFKDIVNFSFQFDWVNKSHLYNQVKEWMYRDGIHKDFSTPVTIAGETGAYSAYYGSAYSSAWGSVYGPGNNATKDYFYEDASFWRLRNVSVAFDLAKVIKVDAIKKLQLVLTGRNILTFTDYTGMDPEISSSTTVNSAFDRGVDNGTLPNTKSYQVGLNLTF